MQRVRAMARRVWAAVLIGLPLVLAACWLASGREIFTKSGKAVDVQVRDDLFGTTFVRTQFVPGPIFGYYIGLDLVVAVAIVCLVAWGMTAWVRSWRRRRASRGGPGGLPEGRS